MKLRVPVFLRTIVLCWLAALGHPDQTDRQSRETGQDPPVYLFATPAQVTINPPHTSGVYSIATGPPLACA